VARPSSQIPGTQTARQGESDGKPTRRGNRSRPYQGRGNPVQERCRRHSGCLARPAQPGSHPGIVVIHEAFGLVDHIRDLARRFANMGYNALAPDLYARAGGPNDPNDINTVLPVMFGLPDRQAVQDLEAAAAHLRGLSGASTKIGAIGFCSGGRHSLLFACSSNKVDAAIDCWGGFIHRATPDAETSAARPIPILDLVELHCPLFAVFGEEDQNPSVALEAELKQRGATSGKNITTKIYRDAGHAFSPTTAPAIARSQPSSYGPTSPTISASTEIAGPIDRHLAALLRRL
jgi:carboxymethylenebutenolidase